jgi:predicted GNAT family N-acyltransferase
MNNLTLRKATLQDMNDINQLQLDVFKGEQEIPAVFIPLSAEKSPQWWCALLGTSIVGAVAAWEENNQVHWGRFATRQNYRGFQIGTKLARFSLEDLFSQRIEEIYMDARAVTVKIICDMGGKIIGPPTKFYDGTVTPVIIYKGDYKR